VRESNAASRGRKAIPLAARHVTPARYDSW
jgi:hypothetical protein